MTKGSKIWLWILMIAGGFSAIAGLAAMKYSAGTGILAVIIGSCQTAGAALLLFKQKKEGFYLICVIAVVDFIYSMINHTSILMALIRLIGMPGITYLLLYRNSGDKNQKMSAENPDVVPVQNASTNSNMESTARAESDFRTCSRSYWCSIHYGSSLYYCSYCSGYDTKAETIEVFKQVEKD